MKAATKVAWAAGLGAMVFVAGCAAGGGTDTTPSAPAPAVSPVPGTGTFSWTSSERLLTPPANGTPRVYGYKDSSIVYANGKYHVFMTTAGDNGWGLAYASFADWSQAPTATVHPLDKSPMGPGYRAAPQIVYFAPQKLWYLIYQGGDPMYSTSKDVGDPLSWSAPKPFFGKMPDVVDPAKGGFGWLDFWTICDDQKCYLFFTNDHGSFLRAETTLGEFPNGFRNTTVVMKEAKADDLFEASNTYKIAGTNYYLTMVEAQGPKGRYFRAWTSDRLDGQWKPLGNAPMNLFAGADNVSFPGGVWAEGISHGEMVRAGMDQTLTIDPCKPLQFLYQGLEVVHNDPDYLKLPYRLGLITAKGANPISAMCPSH